MKCYQVGGAVRDQLLGLPVNDRDWVVVGAEPDALLAQGYKAVGKAFPVFLHPETQEEYALARREQKTGHGYTGFECFFSPDVTLEEDLLRRDLTINAIAMTAEGELIDPHGGQNDIDNRLLRHVSPAFVEDPLRILRVARFAARFHPLGFRVAPETEAMMKQMVVSGEASHLVEERVWQELRRALAVTHPDVFFSVLIRVGAAQVLFPELVLNSETRFRRTWLHTGRVLRRAAKCDDSEEVRFAAAMMAWLAGLEKPCAERVCEQLLKRMKVPSVFADLALLAVRLRASYLATVSAMDAVSLREFLYKSDAKRRRERFLSLLRVFDVLAGYSAESVVTKTLASAREVLKGIDIQALIKQYGTGHPLAAAIAEKEHAALEQFLSR